MDQPLTGAQHRLPWQRYWLTSLLAVAIGIGPVFALAIFDGFTHPGGKITVEPGVVPTLLATILMVVISCGLLLLLLYYFCGERLRDLQPGQGTLGTDIMQGVALCFQLLAAALVCGWLSSFTGRTIAPESNLDIARTLSADPLLLAVWLGPVVWLQAALYEEFSRVFALTRLWQVWGGRAGKVLVVTGYSLLFGLGHMYEGPVGITITAVIGLILGLHYLWNGRVLPLIIAHGLYNTIVLSFLVTSVRMEIV